MKRKRLSILSVLTVFVLLLCQSQPVLACAACFGKSDSSMARGMNMGIFALLAVIVSVLITIATFFVFIARRAAKMPPAEMQPQFSNFTTQA
jgi:heme/copper-type cytochrome/quinol oxidase subunit 2